MVAKKTQEEFIKEASTKKHQNISLDNFIYKNAITKGAVVCTKHNTEFFMLPSKVLLGQGCIECRNEVLSNKFKLDSTSVINRFISKHGDKYNYSEVKYLNNHTPVKIVCKIHGPFFKAPEKHWSGQGCPQCSKDQSIPWNKKELEQFIDLANEVHLNKYLYNMPEYPGCKEKVTVTCKIHGDFEVTPEAHIASKSGCIKCNNKSSLAEVSLRNYVTSLGLEVINPFILPSGKHIDIYIPKLHIGIEYNGLWFHKEANKGKKYHLLKTVEANSLGIKLLQIFEDEYILNKEIVKNCLKAKLGKETKKVMARKLECITIPKTECNKFFKETHLQGETGSISLGLGLVDKDKQLMAVMAFTASNVFTGQTELCRFASKGIVIGGFSKLLNEAISILKKSGFKEIVSFSDNRWSIGEIYLNNGFTLVKEVAPRYWWCKGYNRHHRRGFQRAYLGEKLRVFNPEKSESENCIANGFYKVWDAGLKKWTLNIN